MRKNYQSLHQLEGDVRSHMSALESAGDEETAAKAYNELRSAMNALLTKAKEINSERWKMRETALKQAKQISEFSMHEIIGGGEQAPSQSVHHSIEFPDVISIEAPPQLCIVRLSYGLLNLIHFVELDVKSKTLFTTAGTRPLQADDVRLLVHRLKLYPAK